MGRLLVSFVLAVVYFWVPLVEGESDIVDPNSSLDSFILFMDVTTTIDMIQPTPVPSLIIATR